MGGTLVPEDTPGGGVTMVLSVPAVPGVQLTADARPGGVERLAQVRPASAAAQSQVQEAS
jgi:two-component system, OmpR family, sensor histidine kinase KdpD